MEKNGFLNFVGFIAFVIALYIWVNNVDTVTITEQLPPPQDSWDVVYPKFKDDVSAQLLNTQKIAGSVLDDTAYLKQQNADLQNSVNLLLNNLGILKKESYEESIRQRDEQRITNILSVLFGWLLGAFITKESMSNLWKSLSERKKKNTSKSKSSTSKVVEKSGNAKPPVHEQIQISNTPANRPQVSSSNFLQVLQPIPSKLCPMCSKQMKIQTSPKGVKFFVCPNFQQCRQAFPVD